MNYRKSTGYFNRVSVLLCDAVIFSNGATHIELGDGDFMLSSEYFPNRKLSLDTILSDCLSRYYSFIVQHKDWLFARFPDSVERLDVSSFPVYRIATAKSIWAIVKASSDGRHLISLINLLEQPSIEWRDDFGTFPSTNVHRNITVAYFAKNAASITSILFNTPDDVSNFGFALNFILRHDTTGQAFLEFQVVLKNSFSSILIYFQYFLIYK